MSEASKTPVPETRPVCSACGQINGEHLTQCPIAGLQARLTEALDRVQRAEAAEHLHYNSMQAVTKVMNEQSSKIAELEKALAEQNQPPKLYSTDHCGKHRGQGFILSGKTTPYLYPTCPLCEQEALASSGQGEGSSKG